MLSVNYPASSKNEGHTRTTLFVRPFQLISEGYQRNRMWGGFVLLFGEKVKHFERL